MAARKMQLINGECHHFSSPDDHVVMKQILATHSPDGGEVDETLLLNLIRDILQRATPMTLQTDMGEVVEGTAHDPALVGMLKAPADTIHRISCEMTCKCTGGGDVEATTVALFRILSNYTWDAKVALVLAAFAMNYGELCLVAQLRTVHPLAKSVSVLMQLQHIIENTDIFKSRFDAIENLIEAMLDVADRIVEFKKILSEYISDSRHMLEAMMDMATSAYWTIRSAVACATQITMLLGRGHGSNFDLLELSSLAHKIRNIHVHLAEQLKVCHQHITYQTLVRLFGTDQIDNMKILRKLICSKDDLPLIDGTTKERVKVDVLRGTVMFFISDLDISQEELGVLVKIFKGAREGSAQKSPTYEGKLERQFEIVWLPVLDRHLPWNSTKEETYNRLKSMMPWYLLHDPLLVDAAVIKYIREMWHFEKKPILVVLDPQGKVVCPNALHMMRIWGTLAVPFTSDREEALWKDQETWRLEFLVHEIDPAILTSVKEGRYVCLYGGEDIDWIRRFTTALRRVAQEAKIPLEMVYVGKSNQKKQAREAVLEEIKKIADEKLCRYWQEQEVWFFWARLESMCHSKMQQGKTMKNDPIMQEVMTMLSFDGSNKGWALIDQGSGEMVKAQGKKLIDCLIKWKAVEKEGFNIQAMKRALAPYHADELCTCLGNDGTITELVVCTACNHKFTLYRSYNY